MIVLVKFESNIKMCMKTVRQVTYDKLRFIFSYTSKTVSLFGFEAK